MDDQPLYSLTAMTGRESSSTRTAVVGVVELPWRVMVIVITALAASLPIAGLVWLLAGVWAVLAPVVVVTVAVWLFHGRSTALEIHNYAALLNRRSAILDRFMLGPAIVAVPHGDWRVIRPGSVPNPAVRLLPEQVHEAARAARPESTVEAVFGN